MTRRTQRERDLDLIAEAFHWCGRWSFEPPGDFAQQWENYNLLPSGHTRCDVFDAAAREQRKERRRRL